MQFNTAVKKRNFSDEIVIYLFILLKTKIRVTRSNEYPYKVRVRFVVNMIGVFLPCSVNLKWTCPPLSNCMNSLFFTIQD